MPTTAQIIQIAKVSQYLAADQESINNIFYGRYLRQGLSNLIRTVRRSVEWLNSYQPSNSTLTGKANYLYSLCQPFVGQANFIINGGGTGTIVNPSTGVISTIAAIFLEFTVGVTSSPVLVNGVNVTLPSPGGNQIVLPLTSILNNSIAVIKDGTPLPIGATDRVSFTPIYLSNSVTITLGPSGTIFNTNDLYVITGLQFVAL